MNNSIFCKCNIFRIFVQTFEQITVAFHTYYIFLIIVPYFCANKVPFTRQCDIIMYYWYYYYVSLIFLFIIIIEIIAFIN